MTTESERQDEPERTLAAPERTLAARVNERHDDGDSLFVEPTPREIHEILEEAAGEDTRQ